mmetsp:Transcript_27808/g.81596  ORF Transcript_27808/g.81596 Transcript_27808/m.81596 type:complete len:218 (+) Transcript_27808:294-947(+)
MARQPGGSGSPDSSFSSFLQRLLLSPSSSSSSSTPSSSSSCPSENAEDDMREIIRRAASRPSAGGGGAVPAADVSGGIESSTPPVDHAPATTSRTEVLRISSRPSDGSNEGSAKVLQSGTDGAPLHSSAERAAAAAAAAAASSSSSAALLVVVVQPREVVLIRVLGETSIRSSAPSTIPSVAQMASSAESSPSTRQCEWEDRSRGWTSTRPSWSWSW